MKITRIQVDNFRCLDHVEVDFDAITTFIGPNGSGKSSVLRALDWFFNGDKSVVLDDDDVFSGATEPEISVRVDFSELSVADRAALGEKYAPDGVDELSVWRVWKNGKDKITGKALAFPPFESVRLTEGAGPKKAAYEKVISEHPDMTFPKWTSVGVANGMMDSWEREHPDLLEAAQVSDTNFFGFAGQGRLSGLFDFVLVTADLRASEESQDTKSSVIGRILEKTVDRTLADEAIASLSDELKLKYEQISHDFFADQLTDLSSELSAEVSSFAPGRSVVIGSLPAEFKPQSTKFRVRIDDHGMDTDISRQGHGFQRSMLIAALKLLAHRGAPEKDGSVICLAIEEPELFQHPTQAKAFATILRQLAENAEAGIQVVYATHSPYFVEPSYFDQIRRVERTIDSAVGSHVNIHRASMVAVTKSLDGFVDSNSVESRLDNACLYELRDALFATAVLLVEGSTDRAIFEGMADSTLPLSVDGIEVAAVGSKDSMFLAAAILSQLQIPFASVFDSDRESANRKRANGRPENEAVAQEASDSLKNRNLLRFFGVTETDWPVGLQGDSTWVIDDNIEALVSTSWAEFDVARDELISSGRGSERKNAATYRFAARSATNPPCELVEIVQAVRKLSMPTDE
ncbi:MAG: ATP-dependent endonuclease [Subtercola sp.]|nr:ATP-dependent endonuclease [Subtercola sp.]